MCDDLIVFGHTLDPFTRWWCGGASMPWLSGESPTFCPLCGVCVEPSAPDTGSGSTAEKRRRSVLNGPDENAWYEKEAPAPIVIHCPRCHEQHIDEGEWAARHHKTHLCAKCGHEWRPANIPTVGVDSLPPSPQTKEGP